MELADIQKYPLETQVALLVSAFGNLSSTVSAMDAKLDKVIEESDRKKGASNVMDKIINALISLMAGGGAGVAITAANHAATTIVNTHN